jgi:hypothetical protein
MAKGNGQRLKALYILKILQENSDEKHLLKTQQIIDRLEGYGIPAERKSVYADISALKELGYEIVCVRARANGGYYLKNRSFELPELKLLTDAVQASRLITVKKSRQLISKLETLASPFEAKQLNRQVYVSDGTKRIMKQFMKRSIDCTSQCRKTDRSDFSIWNGRQMAKRSADIVEHFMKSVRIF